MIHICYDVHYLFLTITMVHYQTYLSNRKFYYIRLMVKIIFLSLLKYSIQIVDLGLVILIFYMLHDN